MKESFEYRAQAWNALSGKWIDAAVTYLVVTGIMAALSYTFIGAILALPVTLGFTVAMLRLLRGNTESVFSNTFSAFKYYGANLELAFMVTLYTYLWTLLFVIPGCIKHYSYAMTYYIAEDDPSLGINEAIDRSREMMYGHKMDLFLLDLSFIGWFLLGIVTCGIALFWVMPYVEAAHAAFYEDLKNEAIEVTAA